jgi:hypothetical protein
MRDVESHAVGPPRPTVGEVTAVVDQCDQEQSMLKMIGAIVVIGAVVGAWGVHRGWFTIDRTDVPGASRITLGLDKDHFRRDAGASHTESAETIASFRLKVDELKTRSNEAAGEAKVTLDRQVEAFEVKRDEIAQKIDRLGDAAASEFTELRSEIKKSLDQEGAAIDHALASSKSK